VPAEEEYWSAMAFAAIVCVRDGSEREGAMRLSALEG